MEEAQPPSVFDITKVALPILARAGVMCGTAHYGLVPVNVAVPYFQIKAAIRISADPGFKLYRCSLAAEIR